MQPPGPRGWGPPQAPRPNLPGGFQRFPQGPTRPGPKLSNKPFSQSSPGFNNKMTLLRPSRFSGPQNSQSPNRPTCPNNSNPFRNGNQFGSGPQNSQSSNRPTCPNNSNSFRNGNQFGSGPQDGQSPNRPTCPNNSNPFRNGNQFGSGPQDGQSSNRPTCPNNSNPFRNGNQFGSGPQNSQSSNRPTCPNNSNSFRNGNQFGSGPQDGQSPNRPTCPNNSNSFRNGNQFGSGPQDGQSPNRPTCPNNSYPFRNGNQFGSGPQDGQSSNRPTCPNNSNPFRNGNQFGSGPQDGQNPYRPPCPNNSNQFRNGNPFGSGPRFGHFSPNGPQGRMRGPRPNFSGPDGPRFHQKSFHKNKQKQSQNSNQNKGEKKEVKYFCDTCDRGYKDEDKYQEHINGHEACRYEGCSYIAAPKLVQLHINLQHRSGLAKKIWSLESPEDIKKWIEDRKKNFPTAENIAKKKADRASREERGEVIQDKYFGKMYGGRGRGRDRGRGRGRGGRFDRRRGGYNNDDAGPTEPKLRKLEKSDQKTDQTSDGQGTREQEAKHPDGDPLSYILADGDSDDEMDQKTTSKMTAAGGLGALMTSYSGDTSEEEGELKDRHGPDTSTSAIENRLGISENKETTQDTNDRNQNELKETNQNEAGNQKEDGCHRNQDGQHRNRKRGKKNQQKRKWEPSTGGKFEPPPRIFDRSLLAKLLAKDVRREKNKILQCIHYIVKKDFFGIGKT